jgi:translation initiation factor IF-3
MAFPPRPPRGAFNPRFRKEQQQEHKTNHMIRVPEVRLVGDNVEVGVYATPDALKLHKNNN